AILRKRTTAASRRNRHIVGRDCCQTVIICHC
ncbi:hypothetical protein D046_0716B, partial [Vibrio parahaemolyticus V-223/04]